MCKANRRIGRISSATILASALVVLAACERTPTEVAATTDSRVAPTEVARQLAVAPAAMLSGIDALLASWEAAWNAMDGMAYASHYAVDADFVNPLGGIVSGRAAIGAIHVSLFDPVEGLFRGSTSSSTIRRVVPLTGTVALVDLNTNLTGYDGTPPGLVEWRPGVVRTRGRMVVRKNQGQWEILAAQLTAVQPFIPN